MDATDAAAGDAAFRNDPILVGDLPRLDDLDFEPLDPAYVKVRMIVSAALAALVLIAGIAAAVIVDVVGSIAVGVIALVSVALHAWWTRLAVARMGYVVREQDFSFRTGLLTHTVATAPFARVQDVGIDRTPLERPFGLSTLRIRTAGGVIAVPGIRHDSAERLKALVVARSGELADTEKEPGTQPVTETVLRKGNPTEIDDA